MPTPRQPLRDAVEHGPFSELGDAVLTSQPARAAHFLATQLPRRPPPEPDGAPPTGDWDDVRLRDCKIGVESLHAVVSDRSWLEGPGSALIHIQHATTSLIRAAEVN